MTPRRRRPSDVAGGIGALALMGALLIGLPLFLATVAGSPIPETVPDLTEIRTTLTRADDGTLLLATVRLITWGAWSLFAATSLLEVLARLRGRQAPRLPGLGAIQRLAARLIASAALTFGAPATALLAAPAVALPPAAALAPASQIAAAPDSPDRLERKVYTVQHGDCLWRIAERHLGDGERWSEIFRLNRGKTMADGRAFSSPELIRPGWRVQMPPDATGLPRSTGPAEKTAPPGRHSGHPSQNPRFRGPHRPAGAESAPGRAPARPPSTHPTTPTAAQEGDDNGSVTVLAAMAFVSGMIAGGVLSTVSRMRHRQRQHRRPQRRIRLPEDRRVIRREQTLRRLADDAPGNLLRLALRTMAEGIRRDDLPVPDILGTHLTPTALEIMLARPTQAAPAPFHLVDGTDGMCWRLDRAGRSALEAGARPAGRNGDPLPGLVTAGRSDADGYVLLDLEALRVTGCRGPGDLVDQVLRAAAIEMATNPWNGWFDAVLVGFDELEPIEDRVQICADLDAALDILDDRADAVRVRLSQANGHSAGDVRAQRLLMPGDHELTLTLLVTRHAPTPAQMSRLLDAVDDTGGLAALVPDTQAADGRHSPARFDLQAGPAQEAPILGVHPLGLTVQALPLAPDAYEDIIELVATAADVEDIDPDSPPYDAYRATRVPAADEPVPDGLREPSEPAGSTGDDGTGTRNRPTEGEERPPAETRVEIRVLGPLEVVGSPEPLQPKQVELILVLALHGSPGLRNEQLRTLLGPDPDHPKPSDSLRQSITRTRRRLGKAADGQERIRHIGNTVYRLHDVTLDWDRFREMVTTAGKADKGGPDMTEKLRHALSLIRGKPFDGCYYWWLETPLLETIRAEIIDAAELLADLELRHSDPIAAGRAARAGLIADPGAEPLWRMVMLAEHAAGNMKGVHEAWSHCLHELADISLDGEPHPDTAALYKRLTIQSPAQRPPVQIGSDG